MKKRFKKNLEMVDRTKKYSIKEATDVLSKLSNAKFDEAIDIAVRLGIDPKQSDQNVRGTVSLPHGIGKTLRVAVFARGDKADEAKEAGADFVGADDLVQKVSQGFLDFDKVVATPDMMGPVGKLGKVLGPKGLMPNPKLGTVTIDVAKAVKELKAGKLEFRIDKAGIVHSIVGKKSFPAKNLEDNIRTFLEALVKAKPQSSKGNYLKSITISPTMGPGVRIDPGEFVTV